MRVILTVCGLLFLLGLYTVYFKVHKYNLWLEAGNRAILKDKSLSKHVSVEDLPPLLQAYLKKVIVNKTHGTHVKFSQRGEFRMKPEDKMSPFVAEQLVSIVSPMFSWIAKITFKGLSVSVCDRLVNKKGELQARLFSAIILAEGSGESFLRGELLRYLAEIPWYPIAILQQPKIKWQEISRNKITGSLSAGEINATVEFTFNEEGFIESIYVPDRERSIDGKIELKPWLGEFSDYQEHEGIKIPTKGQVSWLLDSGKFTYFKARVSDYKIQ